MDTLKIPSQSSDDAKSRTSRDRSRTPDRFAKDQSPAVGGGGGSSPRAHQMTQAQYDDFLAREKSGTFKRIGAWVGSMTRGVKHECNVCKRVWKPTPRQCLNDDYYCPSCALHHRNNLPRFKLERFAWTQKIPNTFYLYEITDATTKETFYKYGRTQHEQADLRYTAVERTKYSMRLVYSARGYLKNMIAVENFWKLCAKEYNAQPKFTDHDFHGATECIRITGTNGLQTMLDVSKYLEKVPVESFDDFGISDLPPLMLQEVKTIFGADSGQKSQNEVTSKQ